MKSKLNRLIKIHLKETSTKQKAINTVVGFNLFLHVVIIVSRHPSYSRSFGISRRSEGCVRIKGRKLGCGTGVPLLEAGLSFHSLSDIRTIYLYAVLRAKKREERPIHINLNTERNAISAPTKL